MFSFFQKNNFEHKCKVFYFHQNNQLIFQQTQYLIDRNRKFTFRNPTFRISNSMDEAFVTKMPQ